MPLKLKSNESDGLPKSSSGSAPLLGIWILSIFLSSFDLNLQLSSISFNEVINSRLLAKDDWNVYNGCRNSIVEIKDRCTSKVLDTI